jgi:hypothetical protein
LFLKAQQRVDPHPRTNPRGELLRDLEMVAAIAQRANRRYRPALGGRIAGSAKTRGAPSLIIMTRWCLNEGSVPRYPALMFPSALARPLPESDDSLA